MDRAAVLLPQGARRIGDAGDLTSHYCLLIPAAASVWLVRRIGSHIEGRIRPILVRPRALASLLLPRSSNHDAASCGDGAESEQDQTMALAPTTTATSSRYLSSGTHAFRDGNSVGQGK